MTVIILYKPKWPSLPNYSSNGSEYTIVTIGMQFWIADSYKIFILSQFTALKPPFMWLIFNKGLAKSLESCYVYRATMPLAITICLKRDVFVIMVLNCNNCCIFVLEIPISKNVIVYTVHWLQIIYPGIYSSSTNILQMLTVTDIVKKIWQNTNQK